MTTHFYPMIGEISDYTQNPQQLAPDRHGFSLP
jgi:hypothetical protein